MALYGSMKLIFIILKTNKKQNSKLKNMRRNNPVFETLYSFIKRNLEDKNNCVEFFHLIESYIFVFKIILFICLIWLCWVFVAIRAFL